MSAVGTRPRRGVWLFPSAPAAELVAAAARAEALGLDEYWLGDEGPARDPFAVLAAAAQATSKLRLGVAVTNPYLRHPVISAACAMTVNELSGGRMTLAIGPGGGLALGPARAERPHPVQAVEQAVATIRAVADGVPTDTYRPGPAPFTQPGLPVYVGSRGRRFQEIASRTADGVFLGGLPQVVLAETVALARSVRPIEVAFYIQAAFDQAGARALRTGLLFCLADSPPHILQALGLSSDQIAAAASALDDGDDGPALDLVSPDILDQYAIVGAPELVGTRLADLAAVFDFDAVGISAVTPNPIEAVNAAGAVFEAFDRAIGHRRVHTER